MTEFPDSDASQRRRQRPASLWLAGVVLAWLAVSGSALWFAHASDAMAGICRSDKR